MTKTNRTCALRDERGVALVICLLLITLLFVLGATILNISTTESTMASGRDNVMTSFYLADAGIEHARRSLQGKDLSEVLDGTTTVFETSNSANLAGGSYTIQVTNNILANGFPLDTVAADPSASATVDSDSIVVLTSTGLFENATQVAEAIVGSEQSNMGEAIATGGNLQISGNPTVNGSAGSVHSNDDMDVSGNPTISQDLTASGDYDASGSPTVGGVEGGGQPTVTIPAVNPADYRDLADYVLKSNGKVYESDGTTVVFDTSGGDAWPSNDGGWKISGDKWDWVGDEVGGDADSVFYIEGNVVIGSNPGESGSDWQVTLIVEGYIEISGNPEMQANTDDLQIVAGTDVKINGDMAASGIIAAHEQIGISGNFQLTGYMIAEDAATNDDMVEYDYISGNPDITYNGNLSTLGAGGGGSFNVLTWRQVF